MEVHAPDRSEVVVRWLQLRLARRTVLEEDLDRPRANDGWLVVVMPGPIRVNGYAIRTAEARTIRLAAGRYDVVVGGVSRGLLTIRPNARTQVTPPAVPPTPPRVWPWVTMGIGGTLAIVGGGLFGGAKLDRDEIESAPVDANGFVTGITSGRVRELEHRANAQSIAAVVLVSVGAATLVGGLIWGLVQPRRPADGVSAVGFGAAPGYGTAALRF